MPYGVSDNVWNHLPADDRASIVAAWQRANAAGQQPGSAPTPTGAAVPHPVQPTDSGTDALVPPGVRPPPSRPGVTYLPAPAAASAPAASPPGASQTGATATAAPAPAAGADGALPATANLHPLQPIGARDLTLVSSALTLRSPSALSATSERSPSRTSAPPSPEIVKALVDNFAPDEKDDAILGLYVRAHWGGPRFTLPQYTAALAFAKAHERFAYHGVVPEPGYEQAPLLRRALRLQKEAARAKTRAEKTRLEGDLSATALVLWLVSGGASGGYVIGAPRWGH